MNTDAPSPPSRITFSEELGRLAETFAGSPVTLAQILDATKGRGFNLLLLFIALPFVTPIPTPVLSIPFGLVIVIIGARLALGREPWLPESLLRRELPPGVLPKLVNAGRKILKPLEWFLRPRLRFLHEGFLYRRLSGLFITISGLFMLLPLPLPLSNGLPASAVLLLAAASLERDGLCFIAGCVMFAISTSFFVLLAMGGGELLNRLWHAIAG